MEKQLLREQEIFPTDKVLKEALGSSYDVFEEFIKDITVLGLTFEWNYYKDGKSWLCKVCNKKKTAFWLSVWDKFFKTSFFFTEKHLEGFAELEIAENLKESLCQSKPIGKLIPLIINIDQKKQLPDVLKIIGFKKSLK